MPIKSAVTLTTVRELTAEALRRVPRKQAVTPIRVRESGAASRCLQIHLLQFGDEGDIEFTDIKIGLVVTHKVYHVTVRDAVRLL